MENKRYLEEDFQGYVDDLVKNDRFGDSKETGIAKKVVDEGYGSLSEKQRFVFDKAISHYDYGDCERCSMDIPWCEMSAAEDNGGLCSWCQKMTENDD